jgi:hypothetical protein
VESEAKDSHLAAASSEQPGPIPEGEGVAWMQQAPGSDSVAFLPVIIGTFGAIGRGRAANAMFLMERCARSGTTCCQEFDDG